MDLDLFLYWDLGYLRVRMGVSGSVQVKKKNKKKGLDVVLMKKKKRRNSGKALNVK